jgi:tRNA(Ile)-lysidine synthase
MLTLSPALLFGYGGGRCLVAVSGGADSVALLRLLLSHKIKVIVGHFHHQLRDNATRDAEFVERLAASLGVPFVLGTADVRAAGGNLEGTARKLRYEWLQRMVTEHQCQWIATGHNANDQAETILHHLMRGTGLEGLRGIAEVQHGPGASLVRPLLQTPRVEIEAYLKELGQDHITDETNADPAFTRNRIRAELLPLMATFNPNVVEALNRVSDHARSVTDLLEPITIEALKACELPSVDGVILLDMMKIPRNMHLAMLRHIWVREEWPRREMSTAAWEKADMVLFGQYPAWDFPGGVRMERRGMVVQIGRLS